MPIAETDTAMRGLRSVMGRTLDTRHVIHIFQGKHSLQPYVDVNSMLPVCVFTTKRLFFLLFTGHMVTSSARHTVLLTPQTASTSLEEEAGLCSR